MKLKLFLQNKNTKITLLTILLVLLLMPFLTTKRISINKEYTDKNDVALYIKYYYQLPKNYITYYGNENASSYNQSVEEKIIGGDTFWNTGELEDFNVSKNASLKECDIYTSSYSTTNRGVERLVYTSNTGNVRVFYSQNHYNSFKELTSFSLQLTRNIFWFIFSIYSITIISLYLYVYYDYIKNLINNTRNITRITRNF